jgi:hypothetical protein
MGCLQSASFAILINDSPSRFFRTSRGLRQGCPLSHFLFLIITEALSRMLKEARTNGMLRGVKVSESKMVSHLLFVDDILCSVHGSYGDLSTLKNIFFMYSKATGMMVNMVKSCIIINNCSETESNSFSNLFPSQRLALSEGFKYLGFFLKPDCYRKVD